MAFGNPYGEPWSADELAAACDLLMDSGIEHISLADTVGLATPEQIGTVLTAVLAMAEETEIGVHLHARPEDARAKVAAAYRAGCRRFDMALGGLGGCPFAQDALVGNLPTELALQELSELGAELPAELTRPGALDTLLKLSRGIAQKYGATPQ